MLAAGATSTTPKSHRRAMASGGAQSLRLYRSIDPASVSPRRLNIRANEFPNRQMCRPQDRPNIGGHPPAAVTKPSRDGTAVARTRLLWMVSASLQSLFLNYRPG